MLALRHARPGRTRLNWYGRASIVPGVGLTLIFDADDTLWENNAVYERVAEDFFGWLAHPDEAHARAVREEIERENVASHGYGTVVFLRTLRDCVERLRDRPLTGAERAEIDGLAEALAWCQVELTAGVEAVLTELGSRHELRMLTKGRPAEQQAKIDVSGLAPHFTSTHIVAEKDPDTYRGLLADLALAPSSTWMIGNSPRSDIVAARAAGLNAVFVPHPHTWALEHAEFDDPGVLTLGALTELTRHF